MADILYLVIPCYNEEEVLPETSRRLRDKVTSLISRGIISPQSRILLVNDGSRDNTWQLIQELHRGDALFSGLSLSRNRGHQNALLAGLMAAKDRCDVSISMDADLQDDIEAIDGFLAAYQDGCDIVYGVRSKRETDTFFKRTTAQGFYKLMRALGVDVVDNHADYRLMSRRALEGLAQFDEANLFLRGIVPLIGYPSGVVTYERAERFAGESKYPLSKMLSFAMDGITSFSGKPIRLVTTLGVCIFGVSLVALGWLLMLKLSGHTVQGWTTLMGSVWLMGGLQILSLGIIGEYVGKIYNEVKRRPHFIVDTILERPGEAAGQGAPPEPPQTEK